MIHEDWPKILDWVRRQGPVVSMAGGEVRAIRDDFALSREQDLSGLDYALSLAYPLPRESLGGIRAAPTLLYKQAYTQVNYLMDRVALGVALRLQEGGHRALAIPARQLLDFEGLHAHVNHRQVAVHLGQGWFGRNNLLVTPTHGAQVRLVTVLADLPLEMPGPWAEQKGASACGDCRACAEVCPVQAIHQGPQDFDRAACFEKVRSFEKLRGIGQRICGVCVKACSGPKAKK